MTEAKEGDFSVGLNEIRDSAEEIFEAASRIKTRGVKYFPKIEEQ
jgi:hypothetical protein